MYIYTIFDLDKFGGPGILYCICLFMPNWKPSINSHSWNVPIKF